MKLKLLSFCMFLASVIAQSLAQNRDAAYFNSVRYKRIGIAKVIVDDNQYTNIDDVENNLNIDTLDSSNRIEVDKNIISSPNADSVRQKVSYITKSPLKENKIRVLELYKGESKPLSYANLICLMEELGISNQLYVLAQACLETGWFKSRVCRDYHNLFGLYNSKEGDYYRFSKWEDSVVGYKNFIQYKYKGGNYLQFLQNIHYAEDPLYLKKVGDVIRHLENM